ncbi:hypothetical protein ACJJTC_010839 [Scirpophaga incertulas]
MISSVAQCGDGRQGGWLYCSACVVADCVQLQVYRDARARGASAGGGGGGGGGGCKAALSLAHFVAAEAGFTLDKHSHTLALVCRDLVAVLAFDTRERLMQWQVKVSAHLGEPRQYLVLVASGGSVAAGPARLHLLQRRLALTAGVPPRLLGLWELHHLRRYGVVEGRFCFEGGSLCGAAGGLHVLVTDRARDIARDTDLAARGLLDPRRRRAHADRGIESPKSHQSYRPDTRLSELNTIDRSLPPVDLRHYDDSQGGEQAGAISPYWPSTERTNFQDLGLGDTASVNETVEGTETDPWNNPSNVTLERCMSCISKLGAMSRSSTAALTPGAKHFNPAWTMEAVEETLYKNELSTDNTQSCDLNYKKPNKTEELCRCAERAPDRPPKPTRLDLNYINKPKPPMPLPNQTCSCPHIDAEDRKLLCIGPYENYDVPRLPSAEIDGEYYDTPKRLKECLNNELFRMTKSSTTNSLILKKPCGCLLKFGKRAKEPTIIDADESFQPTSCPCQRVTDWANNWIKLPYCRRNTVSTDNLVPNKENVKPIVSDQSALYATIDLSRKTRRKSRPSELKSDGAISYDCEKSQKIDSRNIEIDEGPLANYENLNFALSLEHYENAKDLLKKAGVTQTELDAITSNLKPVCVTHRNVCRKCGNLQSAQNAQQSERCNSASVSDDYLMMEPNATNAAVQPAKSLPAGYTPMSPIGAFHGVKRLIKSPINRLLEEKSASNPTLCGSEETRPFRDERAARSDPHENRSSSERIDRIEYRKRSCSADSSRFLEDVEEFEGSVASGGSNSSIETLRNIAVDADGAAVACDCGDHHKHSDAESSEASKSRGGGPAACKRSASVPGKAGGNRDSSSSNDSGVSSLSLRRGGGGGGGGALAEFELPPTTAAARRHYRRAAASVAARPAPRRSRSAGAPGGDGAGGSGGAGGDDSGRGPAPAKSSSAEAEVPVLNVKHLRGVVDTHSTSSGTSDMSDYIETLSILLVAFLVGHSDHDAGGTTDDQHPAAALREGVPEPRPSAYLRLPQQPQPQSLLKLALSIGVSTLSINKPLSFCKTFENNP